MADTLTTYLLACTLLQRYLAKTSPQASLWCGIYISKCGKVIFILVKRDIGTWMRLEEGQLKVLLITDNYFMKLKVILFPTYKTIDE